MPAPSFTTRPELRGTFGMVTSTHWLASSAGMAVLEKGGNAFDAAVAAGLTLQVVEPHLNGPGGEVPILLYSARDDAIVAVDGQGPSPAAATIDAFTQRGMDLIPGAGVLAACVPGAIGAWLLLLERYGTLGVTDVFEYAVHYAENGYPLVGRIASTIAGMEETFRERWPTSAEIYLADGIPRSGELFANPLLASTYKKLVAAAGSGDRETQIERARQAFYEGPVAEAIDSFCSGDGLLTGEDMSSWRASTEETVSYQFDRYVVHKCGPWTQGPVFLQQLALLAGIDLSAMGVADRIHTVVESAKLAFADREAFYGDPRSVEVPLDDLLSDHFADERRQLIGAAASRELRPGSPGGRVPVLAPPSGSGDRTPTHLIGTGEPTRGDTCHVDVIDRWGNMVAATPSGGWLQSSPAIPGLGFCLGTRAQMFWLTDGLPNSLAPGKRPRTTLTPSFASRDGEPYMVFGTPGGDTQDQWSLNMFLNHAVLGMDLQAAIDAPNFHTNHFPSSFYPRLANPGQVEVESRVGDEVIHALRERDHDVIVAGDWALGRLCAAAREPDGILKAAADPRGMQGYAVGR